MLKKGTRGKLNIHCPIICQTKELTKVVSNEIQSMVQQMDNRWRGAVNRKMALMGFNEDKV